MADIKLLTLPEREVIDVHVPTGIKVYGYTRQSMEAYVCANMEPLIAEIEALRAEVRLLNFEVDAAAIYGDDRDAHYLQAETRAEQLEEALREAKETMLSQVKWEACDCGCPQGRKPTDAVSVTWLRAVQQVEIATARAEGGA